jgi:hypothetical protein
VKEELAKIQSEQRNTGQELLNVGKELAELQSEQLRVQNKVLDALNAEREKKNDAPPPRLLPKHQKRSYQ